MAPHSGEAGPGGTDPAGPDPGASPEGTNLLRLPPAQPVPPPLTAMCCVRAHREASGRIWYRITATPDITAVDREVTWVRDGLADVVADLRAFLRDVGRAAPT
jgi:hypothetical protein